MESNALYLLEPNLSCHQHKETVPYYPHFDPRPPLCLMSKILRVPISSSSCLRRLPTHSVMRFQAAGEAFRYSAGLQNMVPFKKAQTCSIFLISFIEV